MPRNGQMIRVRKINRKSNKSERKNAVSVVPSAHRNETPTAKYYMFKYKIGNGRRPVTLRNSVYNYGPHKCPKSFNGSGRCEKGKKCHFSHNYLEMLFHPLSYKTDVCKKRGTCTQGEGCARAHSNDDFRILRKILGLNWRSCDPVGLEEKEEASKKRNKKRATRVRLGGSEAMSTTSESRSSLRSMRPPSDTSTPSAATNMSISTCSSPPVEEENKRKEEIKVSLCHEDEGEDKENDGLDATNDDVEEEVSEFAWWFTNMFDERGVMCEYLNRFEENGLDDISFLWELYTDDREQLVCALVKVIGMSDEATREVFGQTLCEYMNPLDVREWMNRVVGLPQYMDMFGRYGGVDTLVSMSLDDGALVRMGISSVGHRTKILFQLRKLEEKW